MAEAEPVELETYLTTAGNAPFTEWLRRLRDRSGAARVRARLARLRLGNFGDADSLGDGVFELRIAAGPGYRVYFGRSGRRVVLLLCAGTKSTQTRDIQLARCYWDDYRGRAR